MNMMDESPSAFANKEITSKLEVPSAEDSKVIGALKQVVAANG
jgi:hypothetical protein